MNSPLTGAQGGTFMKRILLTLIMALVGMSLFAANTGTLNLTGSVPASTNITVTSQPVFPLDLTVNANALLIAVVNEQSNDHLGYTVTLQSLNAGIGAQAFLKDPVSTDTLNYALQYNGTAVVFASGVATVTNASGKTVPAGVNNNLNITYTGNTGLSASNGGYADTLTFTITGK
jgi:hypothetical protein